MEILDRLMTSLGLWWRGPLSRSTDCEPQMIAQGWNHYAKTWKAEEFRVLPGNAVQYLGDEWTAEDTTEEGTTYGLDEASVARFSMLLDDELLRKYLPDRCDEGLEIGPGGGRLTSLLLPKTAVLHAADPSEAMLKRLKDRFPTSSSLRPHLTDGMSLPPLLSASLDFVVSFDVFVHFEPRLVFWYLRQMKPLLKRGGIGIIHYSSVITPIGWRQFVADLEGNVRQRTSFCAFGTMCPQLMEQFLKALDFELISLDVGLVPRDAITIFRKQD